jgi:poly(3-hydroxybutyrate) depolymerase
MTREQAERATTLAMGAHLTDLQQDRSDEVEAALLTQNEFELRLWSTTRGTSAFGDRPLYISLHGGGSAPPEVNDQQWQNQQSLYAPDDGIYVAPRAPSDTWNLWHRPEMDVFIDQLIEDMVAVEGADPNRVYLTGYSAGGDGAYQLAWHLADRFAAVNPNAGHPNDSHPRSMRNLPITIHVGGDDTAYNRNEVARDWGDQLDALEASDPGGYEHEVVVHPGLPHWMNGEDAVALPWMAQFERRHSENIVVWDVRGDRSGTRFYWLGLTSPAEHTGSTIRALIDGNQVQITSDPPVDGLHLWLTDSLVDLDAPVTIEHNGQVIFQDVPSRTVTAVVDSLLSDGAPFMPRSVHIEPDLILR